MENRKVDHVFFVQRGSSGTYQVRNEEKYFVLREDWERRQLLTTRNYGSFPLTPEGKAEAEALVARLESGKAI